jgi:peptidoglycan/xylan/chitin deacetylase (PgdA/CDA1 family)
MNKIVPLVLHRIVVDSIVDFEDVRVEDFRSILDLKDIYFHSLESAYSENNKNVVCLTFDDGFASDWEIVFPLLQEYSATATFFVVTDWIGKKGYLTHVQIKEMSDSGMQIGSHSHTHPNLIDLDEDRINHEIRHSRLFLEDLLGKEVDSFSFPFGYENSYLIRKVLQEGYKYCCTSRHGIVKSHMGMLPRNSINSSMGMKKISATVNACYSTRTIWKMEDMSKFILKKYFNSLYFKIRSTVLDVQNGK